MNLVITINTVVCLVTAWVCICRLNAVNRNTMLLVRAKYTLLLTGALTMGGLPVLFELNPSWDTIIAVLGVLVLVVLEMPMWRHGPPACTWRRCSRQQQE